MQLPINIELHRSRLLSFFLLLFHVVAIVCVFELPWNGLLNLLLIILLAVSAWCTLRPSKIRALRLSEHGRLDCILHGDDRVPARILPDSTVFSRLVVLRLRLDVARRATNLVLLPDSMSIEQFRALRLWLRWQTSSIDQSSSTKQSVGKSV